MDTEWQARYMRLYDQLSVMAKRWEQAVSDHSLEPTFGEDWYIEENNKVLFECRPLADFEAAP